MLGNCPTMPVLGKRISVLRRAPSVVLWSLQTLDLPGHHWQPFKFSICIHKESAPIGAVGHGLTEKYRWPERAGKSMPMPEAGKRRVEPGLVRVLYTAQED